MASRQGYGRPTPAAGGVTSSKASSHPDAGKHPGKTDRMIGAKKTRERGPSAPDYLPGK